MSAAIATQSAAIVSDFSAPLVIDEFDHWHNQPDSMLPPTSITWNDPITVVGRAA